MQVTSSNCATCSAIPRTFSRSAVTFWCSPALTGDDNLVVLGDWHREEEVPGTDAEQFLLGEEGVDVDEVKEEWSGCCSAPPELVASQGVSVELSAPGISRRSYLVPPPPRAPLERCRMWPAEEWIVEEWWRVVADNSMAKRESWWNQNE